MEKPAAGTQGALHHRRHMSRFGHAGVGDDSAFCDVVVRRPDGQLVSFLFDSDARQCGARGDHSTVWTFRCKLIRFEPVSRDPRSFFALRECTEASDELFSGLGIGTRSPRSGAVR